MTEFDEFMIWMNGLKDHPVISTTERSVIESAYLLMNGDKVFQSSSDADYLVDHLSDEILYYQFLVRSWRKLAKSMRYQQS